MHPGADDAPGAGAPVMRRKSPPTEQCVFDFSHNFTQGSVGGAIVGQAHHPNAVYNITQEKGCQSVVARS
jgi:hypothetical protein